MAKARKPLNWQIDVPNSAGSEKRPTGFSEGARAKTGEDIVAVGGVEVAPGVANQTATSAVGTAAQHLVALEPRLRVLIVHVRRKAGVAVEFRVGPLPDIAEQLATTERAVAFGVGTDVDAS